MRTILMLAALAATHPAQAQAPASVVTAAPQLYDRAPWWMREPVIASLGQVRAELAPNRASAYASYEAVAGSASDATKAAAAKVRALAAALAPYGQERVRITTTFSTRPLYDQYRDKEGHVLENQRPDKIDRYAVTAGVGVELRDVKLAERVYATLLAAKPSATTPMSFRLQPDNETNTELFRLAVQDAARRAKAAAAETGARLGSVKLIDPSGRACSTDVLIYNAQRESQQTYSNEVAAPMMAPPAPPPPPPPPPPAPGLEPLQVEALQLPVQPAPQELSREACVVYALAGGA